jgi:hypothetical protein
MILSPLPAHQRKRKFHLFHGELMEEDDHDEDNSADDDFDDEVPDEAPEAESAGEEKLEESGKAGS